MHLAELFGRPCFAFVQVPERSAEWFEGAKLECSETGSETVDRQLLIHQS